MALLMMQVLFSLTPWQAVNSFGRFEGTAIVRNDDNNHLTRRNISEYFNLTE